MTQWWRSLFGVGTQLGECRYKFLRRWAQYGSHSGAQGWEINQYQTGWIRASAWSFSCVDLFFSALFFSSHLHLLIGGRLWLSGLQCVYLSSLRSSSTAFALWPLLWFTGEIMRGNGGFSTSARLFAVWFTEDREVTTPSSLQIHLDAAESTSGSLEELLLRLSSGVTFCLGNLRTLTTTVYLWLIRLPSILIEIFEDHCDLLIVNFQSNVWVQIYRSPT